MRARQTARDQVTLPNAVVDNDPDVDWFDVRDENGRIGLTPARPGPADQVRNKPEQSGIGDADIDAAVAWARER